MRDMTSGRDPEEGLGGSDNICALAHEPSSWTGCTVERGSVEAATEEPPCGAYAYLARGGPRRHRRERPPSPHPVCRSREATPTNFQRRPIAYVYRRPFANVHPCRCRAGLRKR